MVVLLLVGIGATALAFSPVFAVTEVRVTGVEGPRADHVRRMVTVPMGSPLLTANLSRTEDSVRQVPWVATVEVRRVLPTSLHVDVVTRTPVLLVKDNGEHWQLDDEGVVVAAGDIDELPVVEAQAAILPPAGEVVRDAAVQNVLAVHNGLDEELRAHFVRYEAAGPRGARGLFAIPGSDGDGVWVRFGDADRIERKSVVTQLLIDQIQSQHEARGSAGLSDVAEVDVRAPDNPVVIPDGEADAVQEPSAPDG